MKEIFCSNCGKKTLNKYGTFCSVCYCKKYYPLKKNYYLHYKKGKHDNPYKSDFKQTNIMTSKEKVCSICGKTFFTQGRKNAGKTCSLECRKKHYVAYYTQPCKVAQRRAYHLSHLKERQVYMKRKELENPTLKLAHLLRSNLCRNLLLKFDDKKNTSFAKIVGYTYADVRRHLEAQFTSKMSWSNFGSYWQVDHVVPLSWFKTKGQFIKRGWALGNLQPLECSLNLAKQDYYVGNPKTIHEVIHI
jgi:hypothetical protein